MDLVNLVNYEASVDLPLKHPSTGVPLGIVFKVKHLDCRALQMEQWAIREANMAVVASGGTPSQDMILRNQARLTAACIAGWDWQGLPLENGERPVYSHEKAVEILLKPSMKWVRDAVDKTAGDIANFTAELPPDFASS